MNAIAIANEFVSLAKEEQSKRLTPLLLMKLTYIAYGFGLALIPDKPMIDPRFDKVEAWKLGPVIPSVYHTFKGYGAGVVTDFGIIFRAEDKDGTPTVDIPRMGAGDERDIVGMTWKRYHHCTASDLVTILHAVGTPWQLTYRAGENREIPERLTRRYYEILVGRILGKMRNEGRY